MGEHVSLNYQEPQTKLSAVSIAALAVGGLSLPLFFLGIPALVGIVLAVVAYKQIEASGGRLAGMGLARVGGYLALGSLLLFVFAVVLLPSGHSHTHSNRSYCAANLRGIMQSMVVYANENSDVFPAMAPPAAGSGYRLFSTAGAGTSWDATLEAMYKSPAMQGDVTGSLWILVLKQQCTPKQFMCKSDPATASVAAPVNSNGLFNSNFTAFPGAKTANTLSYSMAYPWTESGQVGPWWKNMTDASLPMMSDMAPVDGTGKPARTLGAAAPPKPAMWNSGNHQGEGQVVAYGDAHASFERDPTVGQMKDNIFTTSGAGGPKEFSGAALTPSFAGVRASAGGVYGPPYDTVMVPARDLNTSDIQ